MEIVREQFGGFSVPQKKVASDLWVAQILIGWFLNSMPQRTVTWLTWANHIALTGILWTWTSLVPLMSKELGRISSTIKLKHKIVFHEV